MQTILTHVTDLFNIGKLKLSDAEWYESRGYEIICGGGRVKYIEPKFTITTRNFNKEEYLQWME